MNPVPTIVAKLFAIFKLSGISLPFVIPTTDPSLCSFDDDTVESRFDRFPLLPPSSPSGVTLNGLLGACKVIPPTFNKELRRCLLWDVLSPEIDLFHWEFGSTRGPEAWLLFDGDGGIDEACCAGKDGLMLAICSKRLGYDVAIVVIYAGHS